MSELDDCDLQQQINDMLHFLDAQSRANYEAGVSDFSYCNPTDVNQETVQNQQIQPTLFGQKQLVVKWTNLAYQSIGGVLENECRFHSCFEKKYILYAKNEY